jgi:mRNA interferase HigB
MRVISKARLKRFWQIPGHAHAKGPLRAWYTHVNSRTVAWQMWSDLKADFSTASIVGNCIIVNIGNKYRLVTRPLYASQKVFVLKVMTHVEYDKNKWQEECGCHTRPPAKSSPRRKGQ